MEQILVCMDIRQDADGPFPLLNQDATDDFLAAVYRAIHLAERIKANVHILLVIFQKSASSPADSLIGLEGEAKKHLELMIETARSNGVNVHHYIAKGNFEAEVIRFVTEKKITLLILGLPHGDSENSVEFNKTLNGIRQNVRCAIELVRRKEHLTRRK
ncbi:MAG: universal stress protein [Deltaproteobacteria bacterium]|nr:universal stress protein [Deltaproteobacteria bacterium]